MRRRLNSFITPQVDRCFNGLLYEKVNDPEIRRRLRKAGGFCSPHSFQFMAYHDGLAGSIICRDLLEAWLGRGLDFPVLLSPGVLPGCPVCSEKARTEDTYLALMAKFLEDEQLKKAVLASDGLCHSLGKGPSASSPVSPRSQASSDPSCFARRRPEPARRR